MAYTTINKSSEHFNTKLYTGTGASHAVSVGFKPDLVWIKWRDGSNNHKLQDVIRGVTKAISSNTTGAEATDSPSITSFDTNGFTLGIDSGDYNTTSRDYASWNWKANGAGVANTQGDIASTVSANTTSGFSIVKWTGNGTSGATVGHGLGVAPKIVLIKKYSAGDAWTMLNTNISLNTYLALNSSSGAISDPVFNNTAPTSTLFTLDSDGQVNDNGASLIAYCFADVTGFSKHGSYVGNGNADGTFVYTGFKPAFVMLKNSSASGKWLMMDSKRPTAAPGNPNNARLFADVTNAESTANNMIDLLSNGFKITTSDTDHNASGDINVYMAFAEAPLVGTNNVPATAR